MVPSLSASIRANIMRIIKGGPIARPPIIPRPFAPHWSGCRVGLAPTGKRRLCTAHAQSGHSCFGAIRKGSQPVIGSRGYLLPALRTATPPCCAVGGPTPQRHRRVRGRTRTKSGSRMALQVLDCDADVSLRPAGIPYQFQCAEIAPRRWLGVHLALSPTKLLSSGRTLLESPGRRRTRTAVLSSP